MRNPLILGGATLLLLALLAVTDSSVAQENGPLGPPLIAQGPTPPPPLPEGPPGEQPGAEVQTRGPMHEAFAQPGDPKPGAGETVPRKPPEPIAEEPPQERPQGDDVHWIGGYWAWDPDRNDFLWISGVHRKLPPNRRWLPGYWTQEGAAYRWVSGYWAPEQQAQIPYDPPPPETLERGPTAPPPDDQSIYVPGVWVYRETRYLWRPGFFVRARPGWVWVSHRHVHTPGGWVFIEGYWDHPLEDRGLMYAPVYYSQPVYLEPAYCYRPRVVVSISVALGSLFICPRTSCYVYGDYYGDAYLRRGYRPWCDWGPRHYDPLYSYYRHQSPGFHVDINLVYRDRLAGRLPLPPRTYVQQTKIVNNTTINNTTVNNITINNPVNRSLVMTQPLSQVAKTAKLTTVPRTQVQAEADAQVKFRDSGLARQKFERDLGTTRSQNPTPTRVSLDAAKLNLPPSPRVVGGSTGTTGKGPLNLDHPPKIGGTNPTPFKFDPPKTTGGTAIKVDPLRTTGGNPIKVDPPKKIDVPKQFDLPKRIDPPKQIDPPRRIDPPKKIDPPKQIVPPKKIDPPKQIAPVKKTQGANYTPAPQIRSAPQTRSVPRVVSPPARPAVRSAPQAAIRRSSPTVTSRSSPAAAAAATKIAPRKKTR